MDIKSFLSSEKHLPEILRDFHSQKEVFKSCFDWATSWGKKPLTPELSSLNWVSAHIYTIDIFLRFMAIHGYTLQKSRADVPFCDMAATIRERRDKEAAVLLQVMGKSSAQGSQVK